MFYVTKQTLDKLVFGIILVLLIYWLYVLFKRKLVFINKKGIRIGNVSFKSSFKLNHENIFVRWSDIGTIKFKNQVKLSSRGGLLRCYLNLVTKNKKKYECLVYDPQGFINTLKKLNKYNLLSNDSRYK